MAGDLDLAYRLDDRDRIVEVRGAWEAAAGRHASLKPENVLGTCLYDHIAGKDTRTFVWLACYAARQSARPLTLPYRCDTPELKRRMSMTLSHHGTGGLLVAHRLVAVEALPRPRSFAFAPTPSTRSLLVRCSCCNRVRVNGHWNEPEELAEPANGECQVIYGVCPGCKTAFARRMDEIAVKVPESMMRFGPGQSPTT